MSENIRNVIADSPLSQETIDKQSQLQDESMTYVHRSTGYQEKLAAYHREVAKIDQIKAALRQQEELVQFLGKELDSDYRETQSQNTDIPTFIDPVTGKRKVFEWYLKEQAVNEHLTKVRAKQSQTKRLIGYSGTNIIDGKIVKGTPIYADNNDNVKQKKTTKHNLENGIWTD